MKAIRDEGSLVDFSRAGEDALAAGLRSIREAVDARRLDRAREDLALWRRQLARHLDWEEHELLPPLCRPGNGEASRVAEDHRAEHRQLLDLAADTAEYLRPGRSPVWLSDATWRLERMARMVSSHRDRELYGICNRLDEALEPAVIRRLERALEEA